MNTPPNASKNVLNSDVELKGNLKFSGELTFDGKLDGEIHTDGTLNLGDSAIVNGHINATNVVVRGKINGNSSRNRAPPSPQSANNAASTFAFRKSPSPPPGRPSGRKNSASWFVSSAARHLRWPSAPSPPCASAAAATLTCAITTSPTPSPATSRPKAGL